MLPSKVTPFGKSVLCKMPLIIDEIQSNNWSISELYTHIHGSETKMDLCEYIFCLDALFVLEMIVLEDGVLVYVGRDRK